MSVQDEVKVRIVRLEPERNNDLGLPEYETLGSAGMDIAAALELDRIIEPGGIVVVPTALAVAVPAGYELQIRPRSGLAVRHGITVVNSPGTIDSDYRGEVKVGLINLGREPFVLRRGDRIAQMVLAPVSRIFWQRVTELDETVRGDGGFGHTGLCRS